MNPKYPHLIASLLAFTLGLGLLAYGTTYAQSLEQKHIHALAPLMLPQSGMGSALQKAAFQQPDLLVIYGSSEMLDGNAPYRAFRFFQSYPTGFNVYEVAKVGVTSLDIAQDLAALGPELRGRKVVFSFTPGMFNSSEVNPQDHAGDFSRLHANALIFNSSLSLETRRVAAERMSEYPDTLKNDPVLQFAIQQLICRCSFGSLLYDLAIPIAQLDTWIIRMQDHWEVLNYIRSHPNLQPQVGREPAQID